MDYKLKCDLAAAAIKAKKSAYAPYSHFYVGAAALSEDGEIYEGCNIENAAFGAGICAERAAVFKAVSDGKRKISAIAVAGSLEGSSPDYCYPCGICLQVLMEFCNPRDLNVIVAKSSEDFKEYRLVDLLPFGFGPESLK